MHRILVLLALAALTLPAHARLGETVDQCIARYGQPVAQEDEPAVPGEKSAIFEKNGYAIWAFFLNGKCGMIIFLKIDRDKTVGHKYMGLSMGDDELKTLLDASANSFPWIEADNAEGKFWYRADGSAAAYDPNKPVLQITAKEFGEAEKAQEAKKLQGF